MQVEAALLAILAIEKLLFAGAQIIATLQKEGNITDEELIAARTRRKAMLERMHQATQGNQIDG